jgi:hypothetical protein
MRADVKEVQVVRRFVWKLSLARDYWSRFMHNLAPRDLFRSSVGRRINPGASSSGRFSKQPVQALLFPGAYPENWVQSMHAHGSTDEP